jgi:chromosome segregation ATPase
MKPSPAADTEPEVRVEVPPARSAAATREGSSAEEQVRAGRARSDGRGRRERSGGRAARRGPAVAMFEDQIAKLRAQNGKLTSRLWKQQGRHAAETADLLRRLHTDKAALEASLHKSRSDHADERARIWARNFDVEAKLEQQRRLNSELAGRVAVLSEQPADFEHRKDALRNENAQLKGEIARLQASLAAAERACVERDAEKRVLTDRVSQLTGENGELKRDITRLLTTISTRETGPVRAASAPVPTVLLVMQAAALNLIAILVMLGLGVPKEWRDAIRNVLRGLLGG